MTLRVRLIAFFFALAVVPLVAIGLVGYVQSMRALRQLIATQTATIAERTGSELQERYLQRESDLLLLAENAETERLYRARASGDAARWAAALPMADAYLQTAWQQFSRSYEWIEFRDPRGFVLYRLGAPLAVAGDVGTRGALTVTKPIMGPGDGRAHGTLVALVRRDALIPSAVLESRFGRAGYAMVIDRAAGGVVYHPSHALLGRPIAALMGQAGWGVNPALLESRRGSFSYRESDSARVAAFVTLANPPWTILSSGAVSEFSAPFIRTGSTFLALVVLVTAVTVLAFVVLTRRATRSLHALTAAADEVGEGNFEPRLPPAGADEVGRLSSAFALMVDKVREMLLEVAASRHMAAVGEFAAQLSHEIRNPLTSIKLNLQRLERSIRDGATAADAQAPLGICLREIERLDRVVRGVLTLGRERPSRQEPCALHDIVGDALAVVRAQLDQQGVSVETSFAAPRDRVLGEPEHLKAVFLNLFLNAAEAMPAGGRLRVTTHGNDESVEGKPSIQVRVEDTGRGVPAELRDRVFKPFFSTKAQGTGFGLPLSARTIEEHGGRLALRPDAREAGAAFLVELPLALEPQP